MYFVYLLECKDGSIYTGITNDLKQRFNRHKNGLGGNYTRAKGAEKILYTEEQTDRGSALKREAEIKGWTRQKKLKLIQFNRSN